MDTTDASSPAADARSPADLSDPPPERGLLDVLALPRFRHLLAVRFPSQAADGMFQIAAASLLLFALDPFAATSAWEIVQILTLTALPFTIAGPIAGIFIDRWQRQRILVWSNIIRVAIIAVGMLLASRFALGVSWGDTAFYAAVLLALSVNRFMLATLGAVLPRVVPGEALVPANAVSGTGGSIASLFGAGVGGAIAALIGDDAGGPEIALLVALALYAISIVAAARFPVDLLGPDLDVPPPPLRHAFRVMRREMVDGLRLTARTRRAWAPIAGFSLLRMATTSATIAGLLVFRNIYGGGSGEIAIVLVAFGVGVAVGAVAVTIADKATALRPESAMRLALALAGLAIVAFAPGLRKTALIVMSGVMGVGFGVAKVAADTLVQGALPDRFRGRVFTVYDIVTNLAYISGGILAAIGLPRAEAAEGVYLAAGFTLIGAAVLSRRWLGRLPPPVDVETWEDIDAGSTP